MAHSPAVQLSQCSRLSPPHSLRPARPHILKGKRTMLDNPAGQWGEVEVPFAYCDPNFSPSNPPRGPDGVLQKYYPSTAAWIGAGFGTDPSARAHTQVIVKRGPAERQAPPGYSGSGN